MKRTLFLLALAFAAVTFLAGCQTEAKAQENKTAPTGAPDSTGQKKGGPGVADTEVDR